MKVKLDNFWDGKLVKIGDREYRFVLTCHSTPEQYNVFLGDEKVAYFRLRSNYFSVECPDCRVIAITEYEAETNGYGNFEDEDEREYHMMAALTNVDQWVNKNLST